MVDVWEKVKAEIEQNIKKENFTTWFVDVNLIKIEDKTAVISAPNIFKQNQLQKRYYDTIKNAFINNGQDIQNIQLIVAQNNHLNKRPITPITPQSTQSKNISVPSHNTLTTGLNPSYTLDNFVIGSNNDLAVSVAKSIIEAPGERYNPFFLYGGPGLGKTHLVQAIGNEIIKKHPKLKVFYTPMSAFYTDFIKAIGNNKKGGKGVDEFRDRFMKLDVLIVDDFQSIIGKDASQVEFFDLFNVLYQANKHIIVTSDRLPDQIKSVDMRLASRLTWAGAFDLQLPQFEDRCAILHMKADFSGWKIEDEAIEYIAENITTNIRALEGELNKLMALSDLRRMTPLEIIKEGLISTHGDHHPKTVSPQRIVEQVAKYYKISVKELQSKSRFTNIKNARQVAMYLLSKELGLSTTKITTEVGVKDHTTVMHGIDRISNEIKQHFDVREDIKNIKDAIYA